MSASVRCTTRSQSGYALRTHMFHMKFICIYQFWIRSYISVDPGIVYKGSLEDFCPYFQVKFWLSINIVLPSLWKRTRPHKKCHWNFDSCQSLHVKSIITLLNCFVSSFLLPRSLEALPASTAIVYICSTLWCPKEWCYHWALISREILNDNARCCVLTNIERKCQGVWQEEGVAFVVVYNCG